MESKSPSQPFGMSEEVLEYFERGKAFTAELRLSSKATILVIDDEPIILSTVSRMLKDADFIVYTCENWARVAGFIRRVQPDLVLLDYNMPVIKGDELCKIIKQHSLNNDMKIVIFSAEEPAFLSEAVLKCGADGFIQKGLHPKQLIEKVEGYVGQKAKTSNGGTEAAKKPPLKSILVVDDSTIFRRICRQILTTAYSCSVAEVENGREALSYLSENHHVDLILLDINMPVMNGIQFMQLFRKEPAARRVPIIVCSTEDKEADIMRGLTMGAKGYIVKPFRPEALIVIINKLLADAHRVQACSPAQEV